jgi:ATP-dependent DNA ligase
VLDGEIVCLDPDGRSNFSNLLFRRDWPYFFAFDLLSVEGEDLRERPPVACTK